MPKYTDEQIKKALERCNNGSCIGCPFHCGSATCLADLQRAVLDLINRKEAEIERLQDEIAEYPNRVLCSKGLILTKSLTEYDELINDIASEAIKEFAERLKSNISRFGFSHQMTTRKHIDNLVNEMVGESK